jgi:hypothetical protein
MRSRARDALSHIFTSASFEVEELESPLDLSATRGNECVVILISDQPSEVQEFDQRNYRLQMGEREITCKKLLFTTSTSISHRSCIRWGMEEMGAFAGKAAIAGVLGTTLDLSLEAQPSAGSAPPELVGPEILHLPLKVDRQRAVQIAGIDGVPHSRYIPYWQYHAVCKGEREYKGKSVTFNGEMNGILNAINGQSADLSDAPLEKSGILPDAELAQPKIGKDEARQRIQQALMEGQTKKVRIRVEKGDAIYYEEKTFRPEEQEVKVELTSIYVPIWAVKGKRIVEVNAYTGEVLIEPMDEGVEIL